ncbi:MAG: hypothetical protein QNJ74_03875 [Trichodesmium sp. MO_231.B1]|nr:hypothetical protein [Trichodesmium sp. MO_231.B1]
MWNHNSHFHSYLLRQLPNVGCGLGKFPWKLAERSEWMQLILTVWSYKRHQIAILLPIFLTNTLQLVGATGVSRLKLWVFEQATREDLSPNLSPARRGEKSPPFQSYAL